MTQAEVDDCLKVYADNHCRTVKDYLAVYLRKDCDLLLQCLATLHENFYAALGLSCVQSAKFTVSALASAAAAVAGSGRLPIIAGSIAFSKAVSSGRRK